MEQNNKHQDATTPSCLEGKTILVISSGGFCQRFVWDDYQKFELKIVLVDHNVLCYGSEKASHFFHYDFQDHRNDDQHATNIITMLQEKRLKVDGCITFWDDCGPLTAIINELLSLHGSGKKAAQAAKSKISTHSILRKVNDHTKTYKYSAKCYPLNRLSDIDNAISYVGVPAVLKPEHGYNSIGVTLINNFREGKDMYQKLKSLFMEDQRQLKLGYSDRAMLMEFLYGTQHAIEIVLFQGEMVLAIVSDNGPTRKGNFAITSVLMPTCLEHSQEEQLKGAAYYCCLGIGLTHGVFGVEMKMSPDGPKLIEINGRMSGQFTRDWVLHCYRIDLLLISFMVSVGIRPKNIKPTAKFKIIGIACFPSVHKEIFENPERIDVLGDMTRKGIIRYNQLSLSMDECGDNGNEAPFCNIAVVDSNLANAKHKLIRVCDTLGIARTNDDLNYNLSEFKEH